MSIHGQLNQQEQPARGLDTPYELQSVYMVLGRGVGCVAAGVCRRIQTRRPSQDTRGQNTVSENTRARGYFHRLVPNIARCRCQGHRLRSHAHRPGSRRQTVGKVPGRP